MKKFTMIFENILYLVAMFTPFYLKAFLGETYHVGVIVGALCAWGAYCFFNKTPKKADNK
tara:strand:+ start:127 stop:306 length:180 start_codon:yes stop_codon:yes gene_type:complete